MTASDAPRSILGMTREELRALVTRLGAPAYRGDQIADWLYAKRAESIEEMSNLPKRLRERLRDLGDLGRRAPHRESSSADGTKKYLFGAANTPTPSRTDTGAGLSPTPARSRFVEAAYIPDPPRATLCLSTQVGCKMGCLFCMTARQGFQGDLTAGEIVNQYLSLPERDTVTNIVYMGMGEPLDNVDEVLRSLSIFTEPWGIGIGHKRITVSTIGVIPGLRRFLDESSCHLAVSLHSPFDEERRRLMPVQHVYPIEEVLEVIRREAIGKQRRVSFEYIVFRGINHSPTHVKELARLLDGIRCRINLIRFHRIPGVPLDSATQEEMVTFQNELKAKGLQTTIRASRGEDVQAACGMLSTRELTRPAPEEW